MLAIRLPNDIEKRLDHLARQTGRTKTFYAREALLRYMEDLEDEYVALERLKNPGRMWTLEEIEQGVDLLEQGADVDDQGRG